MILTLLGCVPVLGIAANAYNAYLYFEEGDILNGILSVAGAVVGVGGFMSTVGMAAKACMLIQTGQYVRVAGLANATATMMQMPEAPCFVAGIQVEVIDVIFEDRSPIMRYNYGRKT